MGKTGEPVFIPPNNEGMLQRQEQERLIVGKAIYNALYNRIYDPENELTDAEEKVLEAPVQRVEREGIEQVPQEIARLYRRYKRYEINKFRLRWFAGGVNWIDATIKQLPPRVGDKILAYYKGYLFSVIEQAKRKRLFDPIDIHIADALLERLLDELFPSLRDLEGEERRKEIEQRTGASSDTAIDGYIDTPDTQRTYEGFYRPDPLLWNKTTLNELIDILQTTRNGPYFSKDFAEKVIMISEILKKEVNKKRELDCIDAKVAYILVARVKKEIETLLDHNQTIIREQGEESEIGKRAVFTMNALRSLNERIVPVE